MKLRSRFEHFLAKIAGENVNIETLTPPRPVNTTEELMLEIAGKQLPETAEEDEGKVLKVVDGKWDKGEAGGGTATIIYIDGDHKKGTKYYAFKDAQFENKFMPLELYEASKNGCYINDNGTIIAMTDSSYAQGFPTIIRFLSDLGDGLNLAEITSDED